MLQIAVCDDNETHLSHAAAIAERELASYLPEIDCFLGSDTLLKSLSHGDYAPDIAILDIEMAGSDGISLARELNRAVPGCRIVFLTSYADYAPEVYTTEHVWFVLKDKADEYMGTALRKAVSGLATPPSACGLTLRLQGKTAFLPLEDIFYLSRVGRKTQIVCASGSFFASHRPADLIPPSLNGVLIRCHQGYWVNLKAIKALEKEEFVLRDGTRIPISRSFRAEARKRFFDLYRL